MHIIVGDTQLPIVHYGVQRHDNKRGLVLTIVTTSDIISLADMDTLCENIRTNSLDILVYDNDNNLVKTLRGFRHNCVCSKDSEAGTISAEITNESENTFQIGLLQDRSRTLEETTERHDAVQIALAEADELQVLTMESLMLEVLPELMATTVQEAVAAALAANSTTEESIESEAELESETPVAE